MNLDALISPTDLRDYAKERGWVLVKEAAKARLCVMNNPRFQGRQLVFPMDTTAPDYSEAVMLVLEKLAGFEGRSREDVFKNVVEAGDDAIAFRVTTSRLDDRSVPLAYAGSMLAGAQQLLLASACTVLRPQLHHPRLSRSEAQQSRGGKLEAATGPVREAGGGYRGGIVHAPNCASGFPGDVGRWLGGWLWA